MPTTIVNERPVLSDVDRYETKLHLRKAAKLYALFCREVNAINPILGYVDDLFYKAESLGEEAYSNGNEPPVESLERMLLEIIDHCENYGT